VELHDKVVGFIGLGAMGSAVAARLVDRVDLLVNDQRPEAVDALVSRGARGASLGEIGRECEIVFTSLPRSEDVRSVVFD
jgi:3-hydroxyisobutyrate dehydrogenase-like beta-hydroxyacid dehydrogenase